MSDNEQLAKEIIEATAPLPTVDGGYQTVLADPPWRFANRTGKVAPEHKRLSRYSTMTLDEICALPVEEVVAKNAHLYLWVPNALLPEGIQVLNAWGFRYVSNIVWAKRRKDGGPDGRGVGFYFRNTTELLLFGVRGQMRTLAPARSQVNIIETRKREHSRKPDEQYPLIERCSPGPRLEMFARYPQLGWDVWGDESGDGVIPQGKVHRGYAGGEIERPLEVADISRISIKVPFTEPHQRLTTEAEKEISEQLGAAYAEGASIRQLSDTSGLSIARVRRLLEVAGVTIRSRGKATS